MNERSEPRLSFFRHNARWLGAGFAMTLLSTFGQTSFIALYSSDIRETYGISHGAWGAIYMIGTLASGLLMLFAGSLTDNIRARILASGAMIGLALIALWFFAGVPLWLLPLAIMGLRFFGQGALSHIPTVSTGKWFAANRGRAIATVKTGYAAGEATLPLIFVALIAIIGWQASWAVAAVLLLIGAALVSFLLRTERDPRIAVDQLESTGLNHHHWTRKEVLCHWLFWVLLPGIIAQPVFSTAFFFQQAHLVEVKGWTLTQFVSFYPAYTLLSVASLIAGGMACDRYGSHRVAPFMLLPLAAALTIAALGQTLWAAALSLILLGAMSGTANAVVGTLWPDLYGTRHLGAVRAVMTAIMVFATAAGPGITGFLIDAGVAYEYQLLAMATYSLTMCAVFHIALTRVRATA
ncbi:MFS transporter [Pontivivens insulae]|uniref:Major facilitator superfamily (MFS) profile domain-containing protein n=1 Tax=Pontivivens insulae TaxID=1639689 RepID=A0A2R8A7L4_9RHOB|nr:MFS transporter [Pontivivens insulae]RED18325.1 MFS transporter [Pontivivens insulae]SPF28223.1 hypothetical protein POI8812_00521 [Pontivivens insulae]